jgi:hypothetical protein
VEILEFLASRSALLALRQRVSVRTGGIFEIEFVLGPPHRLG